VARNLGRIRTFFVRDDAATMVEYGFMLALIALICFAAVAVLGTQASSVFGNAALLNAL
jgi:Flp pilus assembly pilin Flp